MRAHTMCLLGLLLPLWAGCGGDPGSPGGSAGAGGKGGSTGEGATSNTGGETGTGGAGADTGTSTGGSATGGSSTGGGTTGVGGSASPLGCKADPPPGATLAPAPKAYSGGTCPTLPLVTTADVEIMSGNAARKFWLVVPEDLKEDEQLPVFFLWHWLGGDAQGFVEKAEVQAAVNEQRFLAVVPQKKGDVQFTWPFSALDSEARLQEEAVFFDDMLACVAEQYKINNNCVTSTGVSAGALFTGALAGVRGDYLSSIMSLSGGTGGTYIKPWKQPAHKMPAFVLWGGDSDTCVILNFTQTSQDLEKNLTSGGHFFLECIHNCGHSVPPFDAPAGLSRYKSLWQFGLDHPYWNKAGQSPYLDTGLPGDLPKWCGIGKDSATPRMGECVDTSGCN